MEDLTEKQIAQLEVFELVVQAKLIRNFKYSVVKDPIVPAETLAFEEARDLLRKAGIDVI